MSGKVIVTTKRSLAGLAALAFALGVGGVAGQGLAAPTAGLIKPDVGKASVQKVHYKRRWRRRNRRVRRRAYRRFYVYDRPSYYRRRWRYRRYYPPYYYGPVYYRRAYYPAYYYRYRRWRRPRFGIYIRF